MTPPTVNIAPRRSSVGFGVWAENFGAVLDDQLGDHVEDVRAVRTEARDAADVASRDAVDMGMSMNSKFVHARMVTLPE